MQGKWWAEAALWNEFPDRSTPECNCSLCEMRLMGDQLGAAVEALIDDATLVGDLIDERAEMQARARVWKRSAKHWRGIARDWMDAYGIREEAS